MFSFSAMMRCLFKITHNGYVYETFGISKHLPVKLLVLLIRAETLDNPLTAKCFIYGVCVWNGRSPFTDTLLQIYENT